MQWSETSKGSVKFDRTVLDIDPAAESDRIAGFLRDTVHHTLRRRGAVLGLSGGVDSAVVLALCVKAFGPERVIAVMMPEKDSESLSVELARDAASTLNVTPILEPITEALEGFGCYQRRDEAVRRLLPEFNPSAGYTVKIGLPQNLLEEDSLNCFSVTIMDVRGNETSRLLPGPEFLQIVAASNFKQRTRMSILYYHAELNNYAVIGTANKNEHKQGFFVKQGDAAVDVHAIVHLYKTQVYQLAKYLGVPDAIRRRPPTTDTYSASSTQQEFFFRLPFETMDLLWYAQDKGVPVQEVARVMNLSPEQVVRAQRDFSLKHRTTTYLRLPAAQLPDVLENLPLDNR